MQVDPALAATLANATAAEVRAAIRAERWTAPTAGLARGYVQTNLVILPADWAGEFAEFCRLNASPCPLVEQTAIGGFEPRSTARDANLCTDVPRYRVFRDGICAAAEPTNVSALWRDDLIGFLLGCSFTFENALRTAGLPVRHLDEGRNVPMFRTTRPCRPAGRFSGELVVSMRPFAPELVERAVAITSRFPTMHGGPVQVGNPAALGIHDLMRPDFGDAVTIREGELPVFWACGVTPQVALLAARPPLAITHSPGCMFVTDLRDADCEILPA